MPAELVSNGPNDDAVLSPAYHEQQFDESDNAWVTYQTTKISLNKVCKHW